MYRNLLLFSARSTNVNRCVQTVEAVLAGLYGKEGVSEKGRND